MAENQKVDLSTLPKGLTKEEFTALPNFKKIRAFFTWAGVVSIVSGIFVLSSIGHISQSILQNGGSLDGLFQMGAVKLNLLFMVVSIVLGILLIKKKTTTMAWYCAYEKPIQKKWRTARYHQLPRHDFRPSSCL